ncbi:MAG: 4Fe-4S dicluster domain-containing protein [Deltaproteobacteria bacterium]|nr:4Fe-4S dicluster domain-containing protein [Deltaproteobacteria bacterium]
MGLSIALAAGVMGALGVICAICLGIAGRFLAVARDTRVDELAQLFGGTNCGACGYASCVAAAWALVKGEVEVDVCVLGGGEVAAKAAVITGVSANDEPLISEELDGTDVLAPTAPKKRKRELPLPVELKPGEYPVIDTENCIACGLCVRVCPSGAIVGEPKTIPVLNLDDCTYCGACIPSCRKGFILVENGEDAK